MLTPAHITKHLREAQSFASLQSLLVDGAADRPLSLSPLDLQLLARHVSKESNLVGLPILITITGTLLRVPSLSEAQVYVTPDAVLLRSVFQNAHFLLAGYHSSVTKRLCDDTQTNVVAFNNQQLANLICEELRRVRQLDETRQRRWIEDLWIALAQLPSPPLLTHDAFQRADLKIIDSTKGFLSPIDCKPTTVLGYDALRSPLMTACASELGIPVLIRHSNTLLQDLIAERFPYTSILLNLLEYFHSNSLVLSSETLPSDDSREYLAARLRSCLEVLQEGDIKLSKSTTWKHDLLDKCKNTFASLPIWQARVQGKTVLAPANRIRCLPEGIDVGDVSPFAANQTPLVAYSTTFAKLLQYCRGLSTDSDICMTAQDLVDAIRLPTGALTPDKERAYRRLVRIILGRPNLERLQTSLHLPDENMQLRPPSELFDPTEPTFAYILCHATKSYFVHESFRKLGPSLRDLGIRHELSISTFKFCVEQVESMFASAVGDREILEKVKEMSVFAFEAYVTRLPVSLGSDSSKWAQLQDIAFVRRKNRRREGAEIVGAEFCEALDLILPPSKMVRREYQAVAWSQRGIFSREPTDNVLIANPTLGVPSVGEVVKHLQVLSRLVSADIESQSLAFRCALINDLRDTYQFLDEHAETAKTSLITLGSNLRFLNVDDPIGDTWKRSWYPAENLVIGLSSSSETRSKHRVKSFLAKYEKLLKAAGVHTLDTTSHTEIASEGPSPDTHIVGSWINAFNDMRLQGEHTDVVLLASDVPDGVDVNVALRAHKSFLAASSTHFRDVFSFLSAERGLGAGDGFGPFFVVKSILDFLYTGSFEMPADQENDESLHNMLLLLLKSDEWELDVLKDQVQRRIIGDVNDSMITRFVGELATIHQTAERARAGLLKKAVKTFERRNSFLLDEEPEMYEAEEEVSEIGPEPACIEDDYAYADEEYENEGTRVVDIDDFDMDDVETLGGDDM